MIQKTRKRSEYIHTLVIYRYYGYSDFGKYCIISSYLLSFFAVLKWLLRNHSHGVYIQEKSESHQQEYPQLSNPSVCLLSILSQSFEHGKAIKNEDKIISRENKKSIDPQKAD